jgi:hypothetical protein
MNSSATNRLQTPPRLRLARAAAVVTVISLQIVWVAVFVCVLRCARGGCAGAVAGVASLPADDCGHSGTAQNAPARESGGAPHGRHCPAANLHNWIAAAHAIAAPQLRLVKATSLAAALPRAATMANSSTAAGTSHRQEISPQFIVSGFSSIPLRI